jgi:hypothetical protein
MITLEKPLEEQSRLDVRILAKELAVKYPDTCSMATFNGESSGKQQREIVRGWIDIVNARENEGQNNNKTKVKRGKASAKAHPHPEESSDINQQEVKEETPGNGKSYQSDGIATKSMAAKIDQIFNKLNDVQATVNSLSKEFADALLDLECRLYYNEELITFMLYWMENQELITIDNAPEGLDAEAKVKKLVEEIKNIKSRSSGNAEGEEGA